MKNKIDEKRKFLIDRLGFFRNRAKLSARELSERLGFSSGYIAKFESGVLNMPSEVLLDAMKILNVEPDEFFAKNLNTYDETSKLIENYNLLSDKNKELIKNLVDALK